MSTNKVLLEHNHVFQFAYHKWLSCHNDRAEYMTETRRPTKLKIVPSWLLQKNFADPCLRALRGCENAGSKKNDPEISPL